MSANLEDSASWEASLRGAVSRQVFHRVPKIPANVNLHGKTAVVTGSSTGLGLECARQFLQLGVQKLILAVRSKEKGDAAKKQLLAQHPKANIEVWILDMESYDSVRAFAARCSSLERLDVVILNAGCGKQTFRRCDGDGGREITLQVNYLATMLLTILLIPVLTASAKRTAKGGQLSPGRISIVGSDMAFRVKLEDTAGSIIDSLDNEKTFHGMEQYGKTKLLLIMFVSKLAGVVNPADVIVNVVNPSAVRGTELMRDSQGQYLIQAFVWIMGALLGRNVVDGTRQYLHASLVLGKESHGSFTDWVIRP